MHTLDLEGYSYQERAGLIPTLSSAFTLCGGWVLEKKSTSASTMEIHFEIQLRAIVELYASLVVTGVELTRNAHATLTDLCTCRAYLAGSADPCQVLAIRLQLRFLDDVTLHSLLTTGSALA